MSNGNRTVAMVSGNDLNREASLLKLRVDDLNWKGEQATSLCDRFRIHMFTGEFAGAQARVKAAEAAERESCLQVVLKGQGDGGGREAEEAFDIVMNTETEAVIKADYAGDTKGGVDPGMILYTVAGMILAGAVLLAYTKICSRKKHRRRDRNENYDYG